MEGGLLAAAYLGYLYALWRRGTGTAPDEERGAPLGPGGVAGAAATVVVGFAAMGLAADLAVGSARAIVADSPLSASLLGLLFLGVATAAPEGFTALATLRRGRRHVASSVLIGSNVTNPLFAVGVGAVVSGYAVPRPIVVYDLPFKVATALLLLGMLRWRKELDRRGSALLLALYGAYLVGRSLSFPDDFPDGDRPQEARASDGRGAERNVGSFSSACHART